jgi:hypothetical protein
MRCKQEEIIDAVRCKRGGLIDAVMRKRGELWDHLLIHHHDNAVAHSSLRVLQFLAGRGISTIDHLPYSPDLAAPDFWLFPELKNVLKRKHFSDAEDIKSFVKKILTHSCSGL